MPSWPRLRKRRRVRARLEELSEPQLALDVGITRSLVKRNVMTFAYSSAQFGFRQQLLDDTMRPLNDLVLVGGANSNPWGMEREDGTLDGGWQAANYLSKKVWEAVTSVVTKATEGMDFFKQVAGVLARHGLPLEWTSPLGLPCTHAYRIWATKTVQLFLYDRAVPVVDAGPGTRWRGRRYPSGPRQHQDAADRGPRQGQGAVGRRSERDPQHGRKPPDAHGPGRRRGGHPATLRSSTTALAPTPGRTAEFSGHHPRKRS
jgi:hypothetical protein